MTLSNLQNLFPVKIILASASPRRSLLLSQLGYPFEVQVSAVTELEDVDADPRYLVEYNASLKARAIAEQQKEAFIIAADTTVFLENRIFNKPKDFEEARNMLTQLSGKTHMVFTGVCLKCVSWNIEETHFVSSQVTFKSLSDEIIQAYHEQVSPLDRAGAYSILEGREMIVEKIEGSLSNIAGLPMEFLQARLRGIFYKRGILPQET